MVNMTQRISDLMDGEVSGTELEQAWKTVATESSARDTWETYHLIGDCLRGDAVTRSCLDNTSAQRIFARLAEEPTVLAPKRAAVATIAPRARVAMAMAASVATLGVVGLIATRAPGVDPAASNLAKAPAVLEPMQQVANGAPLPQVNDYLAMHRQFVNPAGIQQASLVREVPRKAAPQDNSGK
jgi:sigma-E factor negative regulatory protein RseA